MAQVVKLKRSSTAGNVPTSGQMVAGELAMNTGDGKLYLRDDSDVRPIVTVDNEVTGSINLIGNITASGDLSIRGFTSVSASLAAAGGGGSGTVTEVTVGTGLDVTNGTTTPNVTLDLTEITLSNGLDSTATGLSLDLTEVIASDSANRILTTDGDGTLTAESGITANTSNLQFNDGDGAQGSFGIYTDLVNDIATNATVFVGDLADIGTAITRTAGYCYNLSGSWAAAQANDLQTSAGLLGIATNSSTDNEFLLRGYFSIDDANIQGAYTEGAPIYINAAAAGRYSFDPPSAGNVSRIIGHLVERWTPDRGANYYYKIYFNPSPEWIET